MILGSFGMIDRAQVAVHGGCVSCVLVHLSTRFGVGVGGCLAVVGVDARLFV